MKRKAKDVYIYFLVYKKYLEENDLEDDSRTILIEDLITFVDQQIETDYREELINDVI